MLAIFPSPLGLIALEEEENRLIRLFFPENAVPIPPSSSLLREAARQLDCYWVGELKAFSLPLAPKGTPFQREVWQGLQAIPYGCTLSYGQFAARIGHPRACRAVGQANGKNPLPILIPCHRVIAADGSLGGYSAGALIKKRLLALEGVSPWRDDLPLLR